MHTLAPNVARALRSHTPRTSNGSRICANAKPRARFKSSSSNSTPDKSAAENISQISKTSSPSPTSPSPLTPNSTSAASPAPSPSPAPNPTPSARLYALLLSPGRLYSSAQNRRPYLTQVATSIVIYFAGDLSTQYVRREPSDQGFFAGIYDPIRSVRNILIGAISSIPSYRWFLYLGTLCNYPGSAALSLAGKVVINQVAFAPVFNSYFFGMQSLLAGLIPSAPASASAPASTSSASSSPAPASLLHDPWLALKEAGVRVRDTVPTSWYNSCLFWPFVTAFNYRFVAARNRSAFAGLVAVGWQTWLGVLNQRAAEKESARLEAEAKAL